MFITKVKPSPVDARDYIYPAVAATTYLPNSVDLREFAGNIEQQGQTGSCVANAAVSALEILLTRQGNFQDLSRLFHYWNLRKDYSALAGVDEGSYPRDAFKVANQIGICSEAVWPFVESKVNMQPTPEAYSAAATTRAFEYYSINMGWLPEHHAASLRSIKQAVASGYPVLIAAHINDEFQQIYSSTLEGTQSQFVNVVNSIGAHAVLVVGYKDNALLIENSWGVYWGHNGYALIDGNKLLIDTFEAWVCTGINDAPLPRLAQSKQLTPTLPNASNGEILPDEYIIGVTSLLHFDGVDGSTLFKDTATTKNWTPSGNASIRSTHSKFGGSSFYKPTAGDHCLSTPSTPNLNMGTSDFTIELWVYPLTLEYWGFLLTKWGDSNYEGFSLGVMADGQLFANCTSSGCGFVDVNGTVVTNQWQHLALTRLDGTARIFVDGVMKHTWINGNNMTNDKPVRIGGYDSNNQFTGYIDEVRITKGQCRYVQDFAVPTAPFADPPHWWNSIPTLEPIAAWDANSYTGTQFDDKIGGNALLVTESNPATAITTKNTVALVGGVNTTVSSLQPLPAKWVYGGYISASGDVAITLQIPDTYLLAQGGALYMNGLFSNAGQIGSIDLSSGFVFVVLTSEGKLYFDGVEKTNTSGFASSETIKSVLPWRFEHFGQPTRAPTLNISAIGLWQGTITAAEVVTLNTAVRKEMAEVINYNRGFPALLGRRDSLFGGSGRITGTILDKDANPLQCRVQLYDETSKVMTREVWSNATTGTYIFENIDPMLTYSIITYDHLGIYRAVISDGQKAQIV